MSLPRLKQGVNACRYEVGDRYGRLTMPRFVLPNVADPRDLDKYVVARPADYVPHRRTARIRGEVVLRLEAPDGHSIDWLTPGACFTTHQAEAAAHTDNRIAYAVGKPEDFKEIYMYAHDKGLKGCTTFRFNPEAFQGVLVKEDDLENTIYRFTLESGEVVEFRGNEEIEYDGEVHTAANLFDALKEGYYGRF